MNPVVPICVASENNHFLLFQINQTKGWAISPLLKSAYDIIVFELV